MRNSIHPRHSGAPGFSLKNTTMLCVVLATALCVTAAVMNAPSSQTATANEAGKNFPIYDNMDYKQKPDTTRDGLIPSNVIYENKIWPNRRDAGTLPDRDTFQSLVRATATKPGPLVIDIETISLRSPLEIARHNMETLKKLADWAHQAAPGKVVGFYSTNIFADLPPANMDVARELAGHVDAFFPPMYSFDDDHARWEKRAQTAQAESRALDAKKPIYFYMWPQYHVGSARAMRYVDGDFWKFQLQTARRYSDGIVLWGSNTYVWNVKSGWWAATQEFAASLR
jgi:hypothetical protein